MKKTIKYTIIALCLLISASAFSQKKDSLKVDSLTADTKFMSVNDLLKLAEPLKERYSAKAFESYNAILNEIIQMAAKEYYTKPKNK
jgi:hypothetical protein